MGKKPKPMETSDRYWSYERRCLRCRVIIRYAGCSKDSGVDRYNNLISCLSDIDWGHCEECDLLTRQQLVSFENRPDGPDD